MKTVGLKPFLVGLAVYLLATRLLLDYALSAAPMSLGTDVHPAPSVIFKTLLWHTLAAFAATLASAALARGQETPAAVLMGAFLVILEGDAALRPSQDPSRQPGLLFMLVVTTGVMAASVAAGLIVARIRRQAHP